jgi:hypothetical protein
MFIAYVVVTLLTAGANIFSASDRLNLAISTPD